MGEFNSSYHTAESTTLRSGEQERFQPSAGALVDERFKLIKKIGEGGMGVVYLAKQINIGRDVVIKLLKPHLCSNEEQVNRFHREASLASRLSHPNCVTIHDFGFYQGTPYIVMEHLEGIPLVEVLYQRGRLAFEETINILSQTCDALEAARLLEVVHRDLKPENIFVLSEPVGSVTVKVLDFGIAKLAHTHPEASDSNLTRGDMIFGTPQYMSPEQIRGKPIDHRADVYALTIIFYEMVAGYLPYDSEDSGDVVSILTQHLRDPVPLLSTSDVDALIHPMVEHINKVISKGMAKSVNKRLTCADELKQELHRLKDLSQVNAEPVIAGEIAYDERSNRLVTRPSLLFSALGDLTHDGEEGSNIKVVDLLPQVDKASSSEPQVSTHSPHHNLPTQIMSTPGAHLTSALAPSASSVSTTHEPKITGGPKVSSTVHQSAKFRPSPRNEKSLFGRLMQFTIWTAFFTLILLISITYPRSPIVTSTWSAHLPQSLAQPLHRAETWLNPKIQPIYVWIDHQLELTPVSTTPAKSSQEESRDPSKKSQVVHKTTVEGARVKTQPKQQVQDQSDMTQEVIDTGERTQSSPSKSPNVPMP
jgi:serine/threonine protein kinase